MTASSSSYERVTYRLEEADSTPLVTPASPASSATSKIGPEGHIYHKGKTYAVSLYGEGYDLKTSTSDWKKAAKKIVEYLDSIKQLPQAIDETVDINCSKGTLSKKGPKDTTFQALPCTLESSHDIQKFYTELHKYYEDINKKPAVKPSSSAPSGSISSSSSKSPISITPLDSFQRAARELQEGVTVSNETVALILSTIEQRHKNIKTQEIDIPQHFGGRRPSGRVPIKLFQGTTSPTGEFEPMPGGGSFHPEITQANRDYFIKKDGFYGATFRDHHHFFSIFADLENETMFVMDSLSKNAVITLDKDYNLTNLYRQIFGKEPEDGSIRNLFNEKVQDDTEGLVNCGLHSALFIQQLIELADRNGGSIWDGDNVRDIEALRDRHKEILPYRGDLIKQFNSSSSSASSVPSPSSSATSAAPLALIDDDHEDEDDKDDEDSSGDLATSSSILLNPSHASTTPSATSAPLPPSSTFVVNGVNITNDNYFSMPADSITASSSSSLNPALHTTTTSSSSSSAASTATAPASAPNLSLWEKLKKLKFW